MKADSSQVTDHQSIRIPSRILMVTAAAAAAFFAGGCTAPTKGPTDPKEFISQRREWTTSNQNTGVPALPTPPPAPSGDAGTVPPPNG